MRLALAAIAAPAASLGLAALAATAAFAQTHPNDVAYVDGAIEASLTGAPGDVASGEAIMNKGAGNCIACHQITESGLAFQGEIGPPLDGVGDRWSEAELRGIVANAKMMFDGTMMPSFYKTSGFVRPGNAYTGKAAEGELDPLLTAQQIEDVVAYLMTLKEDS